MPSDESHKLEALLNIIRVAKGQTTANGNVGGTTLIDGNRTEALNFWNGQLLLITSGAYRGQVREISSWTLVGTTFAIFPAFGGQITSGTNYCILSNLGADIELAQLLADVGDASASTLGSIYAILGNPATALGTLIRAVQHETEWASTPTCDTIADVAATDTTPQAIIPTYPVGATRVRAILIASIHAKNDAANTHNIAFKVQGNKNGGGYSDLLDLTASAQLGLVNLIGATDAWTAAIDVTALVDASAATYLFKFNVDSDNAGSVKYITSYVLVLVYTI